MSATATGYLASKPRYEILDGLRGVAAMIVVAFHLLETYSKGPAYQVLNHGYLAVDFFFVLSGFVIGYAYDDRWNRMSLKGLSAAWCVCIRWSSWGLSSARCSSTSGPRPSR